MNHEEHIKALQALIHEEYEDHIATLREWAERAEARGRTAEARHWRESIAEEEARDKPWEAWQAA
jgi:hypothetical protein